jgi:hypothetical protein
MGIGDLRKRIDEINMEKLTSEHLDNCNGCALCEE